MVYLNISNKKVARDYKVRRISEVEIKEIENGLR